METRQAMPGNKLNKLLLLNNNNNNNNPPIFTNYNRSVEVLVKRQTTFLFILLYKKIPYCSWILRISSFLSADLSEPPQHPIFYYLLLALVLNSLIIFKIVNKNIIFNYGSNQHRDFTLPSHIVKLSKKQNIGPSSHFYFQLKLYLSLLV